MSLESMRAAGKYPDPDPIVPAPHPSHVAWFIAGLVIGAVVASLAWGLL